MKEAKSSGLSSDLAKPIASIERDPLSLAPVTDDQFELLRGFYAYDREPPAGRVEAVDDTSQYWRRETVSFAAAYGGERIPASLILPKKVASPAATCQAICVSSIGRSSTGSIPTWGR